MIPAGDVVLAVIAAILIGFWVGHGYGRLAEIRDFERNRQRLIDAARRAQR